MRVLAAGILGLVLCGLAWPQATSQISGTVRDQSGLAIPGAEVKVTQTVNQVMPNAYASNKGTANGNATINWLNPAAFAIPAMGTYGTTADGIVVGPGLIQLNMALSRTFKIRERTAFQIRGEAFNLPNHLNPGNPTTAGTSYAPLNSALYGLI